MEVPIVLQTSPVETNTVSQNVGSMEPPPLDLSLLMSLCIEKMLARYGCGLAMGGGLV